MVENYNNKDGIKAQREVLAISHSEMEALLGIIRRDISGSHPFVTKPSEKDLMVLKEVYGTDISMCDMQKVNHNNNNYAYVYQGAASNKHLQWR